MSETPGAEPRSRPPWWWFGLALIAISRVLALFDGPWEADEALFALGVIDFHVPGHRPHPPGFPGFVLCGRVLYWLVGDALLALRLVSLLASVLGVVLIDALLRRLTRPSVAAATSLAFAFVPGVWAHASRAFTTTPALTLVLAALWLTARRVERGEHDPGPGAWALVAWALCVRPQFVVPVALLSASGVVALARRRAWATLARALIWPTAAALVVVAVYAAVALDSGGFAAYQTSLRAHAAEHATALDRAHGLPALRRLCLVRASGGLLGFGLISLLSLIGAGLAFRRSLELGVATTLVALGVTASMLWAHHPAFPRYSVLWVASVVPLVALTLDAVPAATSRRDLDGPFIGVALALFGAAWTWPAIGYMRSTPLPAVAALDMALDAGATHIVHSPGTGAFARLQRDEPRRGALGPGQLELSLLGAPAALARLPLDTAIVQGDSRVLDGATVLRDAFEIEARHARLLGQDRYDHAVLVRQGVVLGDDVFRTERSPGGARFVWLSDHATLWPPAPSTPGHTLHLDVLVVGGRAPQAVLLGCEGQPVDAWTLERGEHHLRVPLDDCPGAIALDMPGAAAAPRDPRLLSLRLLRAWIEGPEVRVRDGRWSLGEPEALAAAGITIEGLHNPEHFGQRPGRWMADSATISLPAEPGELELELARPPFLESEGPFVIETEVDRFEGALDDHSVTISLRTAAPGGRATLHLSGPAFRPSARRPESRDGRTLAAIVYTVARQANPG